MWKKIDNYLSSTLMVGFVATLFGMIPMVLMYEAFKPIHMQSELDFLWSALKIIFYIQIYGMALSLYLQIRKDNHNGRKQT